MNKLLSSEDTTFMFEKYHNVNVWRSMLSSWFVTASKISFKDINYVEGNYTHECHEPDCWSWVALMVSDGQTCLQDDMGHGRKRKVSATLRWRLLSLTWERQKSWCARPCWNVCCQLQNNSQNDVYVKGLFYLWNIIFR